MIGFDLGGQFSGGLPEKRAVASWHANFRKSRPTFDVEGVGATGPKPTERDHQ
jgi:hypothetical protein